MQTVTIDILNSKAIRLLQDLELLQLIKLRKETKEPTTVDWTTKYKGVMAKQSLLEIDEQLDQLRNEWE